MKKTTDKRPVAQIARERVLEHAPAGADREAIERLADQVAARVSGTPIVGKRVRNILTRTSDTDGESVTGDFEQAAAEARTGDRAERRDAAENDLVTLLTQQHRDILDLFDEVAESTGGARQNSFRRLIRLIAVHETAEEEVIHDFARRNIPEGEEIVSKLLAEERDSKERLAELESMDPDSEEFLRHLVDLRAVVQDHMQAEELDEYAAIENVADPASLEQMAKAIRAAEAMAPTRPNPEDVEAAASELSVGPIQALQDRTKGRVRETMRAPDGEESDA